MFNGQPLYILKMLGSRNLKKFESSESCLIAACKAISIYESCLTHFEPKPKNKNKIHLEKNSLYFGKWNFLALVLTNSYIFPKESFCYISGNGALHFPSQTQKTKTTHPKNSLHLRKWNFLAQLLKKSLIFSQKKALLIFPETELSSSNIKKFPMFSQKKFLGTLHFSD